MSTPIYITEIAERVPQLTSGGILTYMDIYSTLTNDDEEWWTQFNQNPEITLNPGHHFHKGSVIISQINQAVILRDAEKVRELLPQLKEHCQTNYRDLPVTDRWARAAVQMPEDVGGPRKKDIKKLLTRHARGRVLETMCGFNSYFANHKQIQEVVVVDFCKEMLERYAYPARTRILYNMENIVNGGKMDFFKDESFQTIGCWGSNYLTNPVPVFAEFGRLLSKGGKLLILENTTEGYVEFVKRHFDPTECADFMKKAGLNPKIKHLPKIKMEWEGGEYYLVTGIK